MRFLSITVAATLILTSCFKQAQEEKRYFAEELAATYSVSEINENLVNAEKIEVAPGAWHPALRLSARGNRFKKIDYCLLVKAPYQLDPGKIKFVKASGENKDCSEYLFSKEASAPIDFYNLFIEYKKPELILKVDQDIYRYKFWNLGEKSLLISNNSLEEGSLKSSLLKEGEVCRPVGDDCSIGEDLCERCESGSYYIKNSSCLSTYSKVCGVDNCGKKGESACIRGHVSTQVKDYCIPDSPVGFCLGDNRVGCVNGALICE